MKNKFPYLKIRKEIQTDNPYPNLTPHKLRAFFCTHAYYVAGYSLLQVAAQAGHYSLNTTRGYIENKVEDLHSLSNKL